MRTPFGRLAGAGTDWAFHEREETWSTHAVNVTLPSERQFEDDPASLSGPVVVIVKGVKTK